MKIFSTIIILFICLNAASQEKNFIDQPYLETNAKIDTLIVPDRIFITIILNEADSKNKKSTEELEQSLQKTLKNLNINTEKDLALLDYNSDFKNIFLKGQNILKIKNYSLMVRDAITAGKVLSALEDEGISNVNIERTEFSKADDLVMELKSKAIKKAKVQGQKLLEPLGQKLGKAIFISDNNNITNSIQGQAKGIQIRGYANIYRAKAAEPMLVDLQKIKFETEVVVKFIIE